MATPNDSKVFNPLDFTIDPKQTNIILSNISVTLISAGGRDLAWSVSADQYNKTHSIDQRKYGTVYMQLLNGKGGVIPTPTSGPLAFNPSHEGCLSMPQQLWQGTAQGFPGNNDVLASVVNVRFTCENITHKTDDC